MKITCSQCNGKFNVTSTEQMVTCDYCSSTLFLDLSGTVLHYYIEPTLDIRSAMKYVSRWLASHDIPVKHTMESSELFYYPVWFMERGEHTTWTPVGANLGIDESCLAFPVGDRKLFKPDIIKEARIEMPTLDLQAILKRWDVERITDSKKQKICLIHVPIFSVNYFHSGRIYNLLINASTGKASALELPPPHSIHFNLRFLLVAGTMGGLFTLESILLSGFWKPVIAGLFTAGVFFFVFGSKVTSWTKQ